MPWEARRVSWPTLPPAGAPHVLPGSPPPAPPPPSHDSGSPALTVTGRSWGGWEEGEARFLPLDSTSSRHRDGGEEMNFSRYDAVLGPCVRGACVMYFLLTHFTHYLLILYHP